MGLTATQVGHGVYVSVLDLFSIGIGPSSSHTVGPMRAAARFRQVLGDRPVDALQCTLHGSLGATGHGHGTPAAVVAGLAGAAPESVDPDTVLERWTRLQAGGTETILGARLTARDIVFAPRERPFGHPNSMTFEAWAGERLIESRSYLSVGGGFIEEIGAESAAPEGPASSYSSMTELLVLCAEASIHEIAWADEIGLRDAETLRSGIAEIWSTMCGCIEEGLSLRGELPGPLRVRRRAAEGWETLPSEAVEERLALYAMAVNEQNAAGRRVVTAPTNGAAGVIPAVMYHALGGGAAPRKHVETFLLTATAVGSIIKARASISGAEAGCQAEVGSACAMAAAGLTAVRGGTPAQVENAAEIAIEHHLGLTCDPVGGLVQIPCIERNAVAASTALTASRLALLGDGSHVVPLDTALETMRQTGADMSSRYKETSLGGLAVNVVEC